MLNSGPTSLKSHFGNITRVAVLGLLLFFVIRVIVYFWSVDHFAGMSHWLFAFAIGPIMDLSAMIYPLSLLAALPLLAQSERSYRRLFSSIFVSLAFIAVFSCVCELVFWNEFHARFNFIAVDYLVYTHEVIRNIWESYPIVPIMIAIFATAFGLNRVFARRFVKVSPPGASMVARGAALLGIAVVVYANYRWFPQELPQVVGEYGQQEVAKNGPASLFNAYFHNELNYDKFYLTMDRKEAFAKLRAAFAQESASLGSDAEDITHRITAKGDLQKLNLVIVSMESMSARFLDSFGNDEHITPNLDRLAKLGLHFNNIFSTGTRTVRGLEALTLSVPPTPGQSIVRRPNNDNLHNIGTYLKRVGYSSQFLYGGYSYFDNMKEFYEGNGFEVWDRGNLLPEENTFGNAWGACDEDLFRLALRRADASVSAGKPFFQLIMTTSNHRPYTFPQKIDLKSGSGRAGAVKYSDYAIGQFLSAAQKKPWFANTIFVFVADHNASVAGSTEIPLRDYRIPFIVYSPAHIKPAVITRLGSQIDVPTTLLALLHFSYDSHFFGHNLLENVSERAFVGTYQTVGMYKDKILTLLSPNRTVEQFSIVANDDSKPLGTKRQDLIDETVAYYQTASFLFSSGKMKDRVH